MDDKKALWGFNQKRLRDIFVKADKFPEAIHLCLEQHAMVHTSEMSQSNVVTFEDELWEGLHKDTLYDADDKR